MRKLDDNQCFVIARFAVTYYFTHCDDYVFNDLKFQDIDEVLTFLCDCFEDSIKYRDIERNNEKCSIQ